MPEGIVEEDKKHIIGAEICMWGEAMGAGNLAVRAFQIGAAASDNSLHSLRRFTCACVRARSRVRVRVHVISFVSKLSRAVSSLEDTRCYTNSC